MGDFKQINTDAIMEKVVTCTCINFINLYGKIFHKRSQKTNDRLGKVAAHKTNEGLMFQILKYFYKLVKKDIPVGKQARDMNRQFIQEELQTPCERCKGNASQRGGKIMPLTHHGGRNYRGNTW